MALCPVSMPIMLSASTISNSCSPKPIARIIGRAANTAKVNTTAPKTPPNSDAVNAAPRARAPSPRLAIGKPSTTVACEPEVPGIPISTEGKVSDVTVGASRPIIIDSACDSSMPNTNGSTRDSPAMPPRPGNMPTTIPSTVPKVRNIRCSGVAIEASARNNDSIIVLRHYARGFRMARCQIVWERPRSHSAPIQFLGGA